MCLKVIDMLPNEFITVTCVKSSCRYSWRVYAGFNQCRQHSNEVISKLVRDCYAAYGHHPYITTQVVEEGDVETWSHFVTFDLKSDTRYIVRYVSINDLSF